MDALENQLKEARFLAEEADKKYDEVGEPATATVEPERVPCDEDCFRERYYMPYDPLDIYRDIDDWYYYNVEQAPFKRYP